MPEIHDSKKSQFPHRVVAAIKMENKWTNFIFFKERARNPRKQKITALTPGGCNTDREQI